MFDAASRHLNFRLAAEELNLTQGAVAQQVRRLESDLGYLLFKRKARGLALTEVGRNYHNSVHRALAIIDDATRKLRPQNSRVTLSVTPSFASKWLVPRLGAFTRAHPEIEIKTIASEEIANFQTDGVDMAIRQGKPPFGKSLHAKLLAPLELCAVCSPGFADAAVPIETLEGFTAQPLIQDGHGLWDTLFEQAGIDTNRRMIQFNQTALSMDAAATGQGIALAPRLLVETEIEQGRLVELWQDTRSNQGGYYVIYPNDRKLSPEIDAVLEWAFSEVAADR